jgi:hypothetical protein
LVVGLTAIALALWLGVRDFRAPRAIGHDPYAQLSREGGADLFAYGDAATADDVAAQFTGDFGNLTAVATNSDAGGGAVMPDGTPVPPLPYTAPRQVRFGVVLVAYAGAQPSAAGSRPPTRSRKDASDFAGRLAQTAAKDFRSAVLEGDPGSSDDVGRVKMGILEPAPEYVLFTLAVNAVGGPVDTPRGFWIVKRLE